MARGVQVLLPPPRWLTRCATSHAARQPVVVRKGLVRVAQSFAADGGRRWAERVADFSFVVSIVKSVNQCVCRREGRERGCSGKSRSDEQPRTLLRHRSAALDSSAILQPRAIETGPLQRRFARSSGQRSAWAVLAVSAGNVEKYEIDRVAITPVVGPGSMNRRRDPSYFRHKPPRIRSEMRPACVSTSKEVRELDRPAEHLDSNGTDRPGCVHRCPGLLQSITACRMNVPTACCSVV